MVGVAKGRLNDTPCFVPLERLVINENTHQLRNGKRWVRIVQLDGDLVREVLPRLPRLLESADNIVERGSTPEVLLLQA